MLKDTGVDLLDSGNDTLKSFELSFLALLCTLHGPLDSYGITVNISKLESDLRSHVRLVSILKHTAGFNAQIRPLDHKDMSSDREMSRHN